jgi:hypothetical protein
MITELGNGKWFKSLQRIRVELVLLHQRLLPHPTAIGGRACWEGFLAGVDLMTSHRI